MGAFITKQNKVICDRKMMDGVEKHIDGPLLLDGARYTPDELRAMLAERAELSEAVAAAKALWQEAVRRERENAERSKRVHAALRKALHVMFGKDDVLLNDFGVTPHKERRPLSSEEKLVVVAKILATRAARHTLGKRQREKIKGAAHPVVVVTTRPMLPTGSGGPKGSLCVAEATSAR
jgi:chorismate mutase